MTTDGSVPAADASGEKLRGVPVWVSALVVISALGGAGWFVWSMFFSTPSVGKELDVGNFPRVNPMRPLRPPPPAEGVSVMGPNLWRVKTGEFTMTAAAKESPLVPMRVYYGKQDLITPEQTDLLLARRQIAANNDLAKELNITPEQMKKLIEIPLPPSGQGLKLDQADHDKLAAAWQAWQTADANGKPAAEKNLLSTLKEVGTRSVAPTRQQYADRAELVKAVLTPQQLEQFRKRGK
jgi:hypothetical protein